MTIDRMVQEKADAYRNNPAALQKNYQMNQDLLDLLALQKIKSEKDAAARELQMSMEQNPQTIAEQRGVEAVDRTKDDLVKQVGGVAAQRQRQQQQNIQSPPPPPPPPPPRAPPRAGQPPPNRGRQRGGIVSLAGPDGSEVKAKTPKELLEEAGYTPERFAALSEEEKQNVLQTINVKRGATRLASDVVAPFAAAADVGLFVPRMVADAADVGARALGLRDAAAKPFIETKTPAYDALRRVDQRNQPVDMSRLQPPVNTASMVAQDMRQPNAMGGQLPASAGGPPAPVSGSPADIQRMQQGQMTGLPPAAGGGISTAFSPITAPVIDTDSVEKGRDINYRGQAVSPERIADIAGKEQGIYARNLIEQNRDSEAERLARQAQADKFQNRSGIAKIREEQTRQQRDLNERNAASRRDNRFYELLARAGGQGALSNIGRASSDMRAADRMQEQVDLANVFAREDLGVKDDLAISSRSLVSGDKQYELSENARKQAASNNQQLVSNMRTNLTKDAIGFLQADTANLSEDARYRRDLIGVLTANAGNKLKADIANMQGRLESEANSIKSMIGKAKNRSSWVEVIDKIELNIAGINQKYDKLISDALQNDPRLRALRVGNDPKKLEEARILEAEIKTQWRSLADATLETYNKLKIYSLQQSGILSDMPAGSGSGSGSSSQPPRVLRSRPVSP